MGVGGCHGCGVALPVVDGVFVDLSSPSMVAKPSRGVGPARLRCPLAVPAGLGKAVTLGMLPAARRHALRHVLAGAAQPSSLYVTEAYRLLSSRRK